MRLKTISTVLCTVVCALAFSGYAKAAPVLGPSVTWTTGTGANQHLYQMYDDSAGISFLAANSFANASTVSGYSPGRLASITSANEQAFLHSFNLAQTSVVEWWAGGTDNTTLGTTANEWIWTDGSGNFFDQGGAGNPQNGLYMNWNAGEPNGTGDGEYALVVLTNGLWNDLGTQPRTRFIIEFVAVPEPASVAIWSLIGLGATAFGLYRVRRAQAGSAKA